jgi:hypothetical protein
MTSDQEPREPTEVSPPQRAELLSDADDYELSTRGVEFIYSQLNLLEDLADVTSMLKKSVEPSRHHIAFTYPKHQIPEGLIPESITDYIFVDRLEKIQVDIVKEEGSFVGCTIVISAGGREIHLSRDPSMTVAADDLKDILIIGDSEPREINSLGHDDFVRLLVGLVQRQAVDRDVNLADVNILAPELLENLTTTLYRSSPFVEERYSYDVSSVRTINFNIERFRDSESIRTIDFTYETANPDRRIQCSVDLTTGLELTFKALEHKVEPFKPNAGDIMRLQEIVDELVQTLRSGTDDLTSSTTPLSIDTLTEDGIVESITQQERYGQSPDIDN